MTILKFKKHVRLKPRAGRVPRASPVEEAARRARQAPPRAETPVGALLQECAERGGGGLQ